MAEGFSLRKPHPPALRIVLAAIGLFCIAMPGWELRQALLAPGLWSIPFLVIIAGAWSVGALAIWAAIAGADARWQVEPGAITLTRRSLLRSTVTRITSADIAGMQVRTIDWDGGPDTYAVTIALYDGSRVETPDVASARAADALQQRLRDMLGEPPTRERPVA